MPTAISGNDVVVDGESLINAKILGSAEVALSGTSVDFTGIPLGVKRVKVLFKDISLNATTNIVLQLGDTGGFITSGYAGSAWAASTTNIAHTVGFVVSANTNGSFDMTGAYTFDLLDDATFTWIASMSGGYSNTTGGLCAGGSVSITSDITQIRVTSISGTAAFDNGSIKLSWEF